MRCNGFSGTWPDSLPTTKILFDTRFRALQISMFGKFSHFLDRVETRTPRISIMRIDCTVRLLLYNG